MARQSRVILESWIEDINLNGRNLTDWEIDFMASMTERVEEGEFISENAEGHIERIRAQRCR